MDDGLNKPTMDGGLNKRQRLSAGSSERPDTDMAVKVSIVMASPSAGGGARRGGQEMVDIIIKLQSI